MAQNRKLAAAIASLGLLLLAGASPAVAQELPSCPADEEAVATFPPSYVRAGQGYSVEARKSVGYGISALTITYTTDAGTTTENLPFDDPELRIVRSAPNSGRLALTFSWVESPGEPDACRGTDSYPNIRVIGAKQKAGRPEVMRLTGSYRAKWSDDRNARRWTAVPRCDVFGCSTRVRSSGGLRGVFFPQEDGTYRLTERRRHATCVVTYSTGRVVEWAIFSYRRVSLRVTESRHGIATRLSGRETITYDAPSDEFGSCSVPGTYRSTARLQRR